VDSEVAGYRFQPQGQRPVFQDRPEAHIGDHIKFCKFQQNEYYI